jgi:hypothetical protein
MILICKRDKQEPPSCRLHKPTNQPVVIINGQSIRTLQQPIRKRLESRFGERRVLAGDPDLD